MSTDPAISDYLPKAPIDDEAKKYNENLSGQGGIFNVTNLHLYHYSFNNPIRYIVPNGREGFDSSITPEQYEKSGLPNQYTWDQVQKFFKDNPDGMLFRFDTIMYMEYSNKKDIKDPSMQGAADMLNIYMAGKAVAGIGKSIFSFVNAKKGVTALQKIAESSALNNPSKKQLINVFKGKLRIEKGVEAIPKSVQQELGVKISGAIQKPWHLVIGGNEIPLNPFNKLWSFFK